MTFVEALGELGLEAGAPPEAIRAAYLKLLRVRRPDRDPEGFRRLREAYERAQSEEADDEPDEEVLPSFTIESAWKRELKRIGSDPLRALQRIHVLDIEFSRSRDDEEVVMALLEELVAAEMADGVAGVLAAHRPVSSTRPWEWALRMVPGLAPLKVLATLHEVEPVFQLRMALLLETLRHATANARSLSVDAMRELRETRTDDALVQLDGVRDPLPLELWLITCLLLLDADVSNELASLTEADATLIGATLRESAPAAYAKLEGRLPPAAAAELPGDPNEDPMIRFLQLQMTHPVKGREALAELARRQPGDPTFTQQLVEALFAEGKRSEIAAVLSAHAGASRQLNKSSPVWKWAVLESSNVLKLTEPAPEVSLLWMRVMAAWALAASGNDADTAARMLSEVVSSTPESELLAARQLLLVAMFEVCARSMSVERSRLLEWLCLFIREPDFEFVNSHERQVLDRTMQVVVTRLRNDLVSTNWVRQSEVTGLGERELLELRDRVRVENPELKPRLPPLSFRL